MNPPLITPNVGEADPPPATRNVPQAQPPRRAATSLPALAALLTAALLLTALDGYARHRLKRGAAALAALNLPENTRGTALQRQLLARPDALPVYGSSELDIDQPTRADLFFPGHQHPGFQAFVIGQPGDRCLVMLQELAALGEAVRGRKIALFLSPVWFLPTPAGALDLHSEHRQVAATFSPLQAGLCLTNGSLRPAARQVLAARLLEYDNVIRARSPLLHHALVGLAYSAWADRCRWWAVRPLLALETAILARQDRYHQLELLRARPRPRPAGRPYVPRHKGEGWDRLLADVARSQAKGSRAIPAVDNALLVTRTRDLRSRRHAPGSYADNDADFLRRMAGSPEWGDLDLLLGTLRGLGARPLLINQPINGLLSDGQGVTPAARRKYYERVEEVAARHHVAVRDFSGSEDDPAFFRDAVHPSAKAWVLYDRALAEFYGNKRS